MTVLICDDERDIVSALKIYLEAEGYETVSAPAPADERALRVLIKEEGTAVLDGRLFLFVEKGRGLFEHLLKFRGFRL